MIPGLQYPHIGSFQHGKQVFLLASQERQRRSEEVRGRGGGLVPLKATWGLPDRTE